MIDASDDGRADEYVIPTTGFAQDAAVPVVCLVLFALLFLGGAYSVATGAMRLPDKPIDGIDLRDPGNQQAGVIIGLLALGQAVYLSYQGLVHGNKPFVFDRKSGQFRRGKKPLCPLSEIREVRIREQRIEEHSCYRLWVIRAAARPIGFGPFLRFSREGAETRKAQIEAFLGLPTTSIAPELTAPAPMASVPAGVWDRQLDG